MVLPSQVDYCVDGDHLTLWGHDRTNVLDVVGAPGARTLSFTRIACGNGIKEHGEACDPPDGVTCDDELPADRDAVEGAACSQGLPSPRPSRRLRASADAASSGESSHRRTGGAYGGRTFKRPARLAVRT